jgi:hypothetical protein
VVSVLLHPDVPPGCLVLGECLLLNSKVCSGEMHRWTAYQGESFAYDAREGVVGDTALRSKGTRLPLLSSVLFHVRRREARSEEDCGLAPLTVDAGQLGSALAKQLFMSILTVDEVMLGTEQVSNAMLRIHTVILYVISYVIYVINPTHTPTHTHPPTHTPTHTHTHTGVRHGAGVPGGGGVHGGRGRRGYAHTHTHTRTHTHIYIYIYIYTEHSIAQHSTTKHSIA